jgi:hypothetical protein
MNMRRRRLLHPIALSLVLVCFACARAGAEVQISGTRDRVAIQTDNASMAEILSELSSTFKLRIELTGSSARRFTGAYSGSLRRVLSRLLDGEDYVIRSAGDGINIVLLGPKAAGPTLRLAAGDPEPVNPVQGWSPAAIAAPAVAPKEPAPRADSGQLVRLAAADGDASNPIQGWTGSSDLFAKPLSPAAPAAPAQANAADAAKPQTADAPDGDSRVQGWVPTAVQDPLKDLGAKAAPVVDDAATPSATDEDEGNPNFQGFMPGWTPPEPGNSLRGVMPTLPVPTPGPHGQ